MRTALGTLDVHLRPSSICIKILRVAWKKKRKTLRKYFDELTGLRVFAKGMRCERKISLWRESSLN